MADEDEVEVFDRLAVVSRRSSSIRPWPGRSGVLVLRLDDLSFLVGTTVRVTIDVSWDGGQTFPWSDTTDFQGGAKSGDGSAPSIQLGPFLRRGRQSDNPTHVRVSLDPIRGLPVVGLRGNI